MKDFYEDISFFLTKLDQFVWGPPLLTLLIGVGVYFSFRLGFLQVRRLPLALSYLFGFKKEKGPKKGDVSSFEAVCTALSATVGTGNIVGVATAIKLGGPGALFWMWVAAFVGMMTKYAECLLGLKYRRLDDRGQVVGGPMYYLEHAVKGKWLAKLFAFFALTVAFLGIGTFPQVNAIVDSSLLSFNIPKEVTAFILTILVAFVTLGGIKWIARVASFLIPAMVIFYVISCFFVLGSNLEALPRAFSLILSSAFNGHAATGGFIGAGFMLALQSGVARGVFSNESGLGSAAIAAAAGRTNSCVRQGLVSMTGTFFDTLIICTMTGFTLVLTNVWQSDLAGASMTTEAFALGLGSSYWGPLLISISLILFAFTTILGWNYYGERCAVYLFGAKGILPYKVIFLILIAFGAFLKLDMIWVIANIVNGLMGLPNLLGLLLLRNVVISETEDFFK